MTSKPNLFIQQQGRYLSPTAQRTGGKLGMVLEQVRAEFMQNMRLPEFLMGTIAIPVILFFMFGVPNASQTFPDGTRIGTLMMVSFGAYGMLTLALFTFGVDIANERGRGWHRLIRATPLPGWVYFVGKFMMALLFAALTLLAMFAVGYLFAGVRQPFIRWVQMFGVLLTGALAFSTLGFALGYLTRPKAASVIANLVFLPLSFVSGFFFPLSQLPEFIQQLAPYLPTYHFGQLAWLIAGHPDDVALFVGQTAGEPLVHTLWLIGSFVIFGILAIVGYRQDKERSLT
jgi:ABC-2 type transport system permease protein